MQHSSGQVLQHTRFPNIRDHNIRLAPALMRNARQCTRKQMVHDLTLRSEQSPICIRRRWMDQDLGITMRQVQLRRTPEIISATRDQHLEGVRKCRVEPSTLQAQPTTTHFWLGQQIRKHLRMMGSLSQRREKRKTRVVS